MGQTVHTNTSSSQPSLPSTRGYELRLEISGMRNAAVSWMSRGTWWTLCTFTNFPTLPSIRRSHCHTGDGAQLQRRQMQLLRRSRVCHTRLFRLAGSSNTGLSLISGVSDINQNTACLATPKQDQEARGEGGVLSRSAISTRIAMWTAVHSMVSAVQTSVTANYTFCHYIDLPILFNTVESPMEEDAIKLFILKH